MHCNVDLLKRYCKKSTKEDRTQFDFISKQFDNIKFEQGMLDTFLG